MPIPGEPQCGSCHTARCWPTRSTFYRCGCPRGADRVVSEAPSPGFTEGPLGRVAATRTGVSPPGAGVGSFSGGKGNGAGSRNHQAAGGVVEVPPLGGLSPRAQGGDLPAPLPVGEVRSSRRVTFSDTSGPDEVLKAVDLLGGVLAGFGIDIEALKSTLRSPPPPSRVMLLLRYVCWHRSVTNVRRKWNSFRRNFRLGGVGFLGPLRNWRVLGVL